MGASKEQEWRFSQCFGDRGEEEVTDADVISAIEFDETGRYLATGDRGGRVVLFECPENSSNQEYTFYAEFQSHEPEFDYLKSLEIEEKINKICWCKRLNASHFLLTTNNKTIKLWKVFEKTVKVTAEPEETEDKDTGAPLSNLKFPSIKVKNTVTSAVPKRIYENAHTYHVNSLSINSDGETFISADDLRINLWNINVSTQSFNIVDIKPPSMEELSEVITAAEFHPSQCNLFIFSSSKGTIKLNDMRQGALCDHHSKLFEVKDTAQKSFFSEIVTSISDIKFSKDGRYIFSRDYLTLKVWDINMEKKPLKVINVDNGMKPKLSDLYENDFIFDKFECVPNSTADKLLTGSYGNYFHIFDIPNNKETIFQTDKNTLKLNQQKRSDFDENGSNTVTGSIPSLTREDFRKKILHVAWHPLEDTIALSATNNLFLFKA